MIENTNETMEEMEEMEVKEEILAPWVAIYDTKKKSPARLFSVGDGLWTEEALEMEKFFAESREDLQGTLRRLFGRVMRPTKYLASYEKILSLYKKYRFSQADCADLLELHRVEVYNGLCKTVDPSLGKLKLSGERSFFPVSLFSKAWDFLEMYEIEAYHHHMFQYTLKSTEKGTTSYTGETMAALMPTIQQATAVLVELEEKKTTYLLRKNILKELLVFCERFYAPGNLIPVPEFVSLHQESLSKALCWDVALMKIKKFFDGLEDENRETQKEALLELVSVEDITEISKISKEEKCALNAVGKWLSHWPSWDEFVMDNYLTMYVDLESEDWAVLPIWDGHTLEHALEHSLAPKGKDFYHYLQEVNRRIGERDKELMLRIKG